MLGRYPQALGNADEAVEIFQGYVMAGRERYVSNLAYGRYRQAELLTGMSRPRSSAATRSPVHRAEPSVTCSTRDCL
jgi:hypothetical protein